MNIFSIIIKIIACFLLMFFDLAAFVRIGLSGWWRRTQHHGKLYNNVCNIACIFVAVCIGNAAFVEIQ